MPRKCLDSSLKIVLARGILGEQYRSSRLSLFVSCRRFFKISLSYLTTFEYNINSFGDNGFLSLVSLKLQCGVIMNNSIVTSSKTFAELQKAIDERYEQYRNGLINLGEYCESVRAEVETVCEKRLADSLKDEFTGLPLPEYERLSRYAAAWRFCEALKRDLNFHLSHVKDFN